MRTAGLASVTIAAGVLAFPVHAQNVLDSLFGGGGGIFGAPQPQASPPQPPQYRAPDRGGLSFDRRRHPSSGEAADSGEGSGRHSICVRLCDGYAFPVGIYHGSGERTAHEAACRTACPGAKTALFLSRGGDDPLDGAVRVDSRESYAKLPNAFKFKTTVSPACTCHPEGGSRVASLLRDFTLRKGDAVMTDHGLKVFHGGESFPFEPKDFLALSHSRDVPKQNRPVFEAMNRARQAVPLPRFETNELTVFRKKQRVAPNRLRAEPRATSNRGAT